MQSGVRVRRRRVQERTLLPLPLRSGALILRKRRRERDTRASENRRHTPLQLRQALTPFFLLERSDVNPSGVPLLPVRSVVANRRKRAPRIWPPANPSLQTIPQDGLLLCISIVVLTLPFVSVCPPVTTAILLQLSPIPGPHLSLRAQWSLIIDAAIA